MGPLFDELRLAGLPRVVKTIDQTVALNQAVNERLRYVIREESGVWTPEQTLAEGRGSCRDSAVLLVAALRPSRPRRTLRQRLPRAAHRRRNDPRRRRAASHATSSTCTPGPRSTCRARAGSGSMRRADCSAARGTSRSPALPGPRAASPMDGTSDVPAKEVTFEMKVGRLGHEPRPTAPFPEETWTRAPRGGRSRRRALLSEHGVELTVGGEPDVHVTPPPGGAGMERRSARPDQSGSRASRSPAGCATRLVPGGALLHRYRQALSGREPTALGARHPGRRDGVPLVNRPATDRARGRRRSPTRGASIEALAESLGSRGQLVLAALRRSVALQLREEATAPGRRRSASRRSPRFSGGAPEAGPRCSIAASARRSASSSRSPSDGGRWCGHKWTFRRERLYLVPGDSPIGLRLPLDPSKAGPLPFRRKKRTTGPPIPRRGDLARRGGEAGEGPGCRGKSAPRHGPSAPPSASSHARARLFVFLPPLLERCALPGAGPGDRRYIGCLDLPRRPRGLPAAEVAGPLAHLSSPPIRACSRSTSRRRATSREHAALMEAVFDAALHAGLHAEKYQLDGRQSGQRRRQPRHARRADPSREPVREAARSSREPPHLRAAPPVALVPVHRALRRAYVPGAAPRRSAARRPLRAGDRPRAGI